jgi:hypothetical protein
MTDEEIAANARKYTKLLQECINEALNAGIRCSLTIMKRGELHVYCSQVLEPVPIADKIDIYISMQKVIDL